MPEEYVIPQGPALVHACSQRTEGCLVCLVTQPCTRICSECHVRQHSEMVQYRRAWRQAQGQAQGRYLVSCRQGLTPQFACRVRLPRAGARRQLVEVQNSDHRLLRIVMPEVHVIAILLPESCLVCLMTLSCAEIVWPQACQHCEGSIVFQGLESGTRSGIRPTVTPWQTRLDPARCLQSTPTQSRSQAAASRSPCRLQAQGWHSMSCRPGLTPQSACRVRLPRPAARQQLPGGRRQLPGALAGCRPG